ncbi:VOC family protein [Amycolatopsis sp. CA-230715]|uniref:VOC family protein n=1 Tax=Amycolatopsis sp. CA-230715 TaxID=2745196 RepID=UPI001C018832|nr:VOC family protein [Amycolatopsis sp. CA-230715]QWF78462.1 Putative glyoxylase CFP32 [Amycolatopsis sp. CA-230715]
MSLVTANQPDGTPTWVELGVPDVPRAEEFYRALFGWEYEEWERGTRCLLRGRPVAGFTEGSGWLMYFAADDCDATAKRAAEAGGAVLSAPADTGDRGRAAVLGDPSGARFGLWEGRAHHGCHLVNEPNTLVRNDLATPEPARARSFYAEVFDFTLDGNPDLPGFDFTFLRRRDGHEIGGIFGDPAATPAWMTTFEVADADSVARAAVDAGGSAGPVEDNPYGRIAQLTDPFGTGFAVIARH